MIRYTFQISHFISLYQREKNETISNSSISGRRNVCALQSHTHTHLCSQETNTKKTKTTNFATIEKCNMISFHICHISSLMRVSSSRKLPAASFHHRTTTTTKRSHAEVLTWKMFSINYKFYAYEIFHSLHLSVENGIN